MGISFYTFQNFVQRLTERGDRVVIVEGRYHPLGLSEKNLDLKRRCHALMRTLAEDNERVRFIGLDRQPELQARTSGTAST